MLLVILQKSEVAIAYMTLMMYNIGGTVVGSIKIRDGLLDTKQIMLLIQQHLYLII